MPASNPSHDPTVGPPLRIGFVPEHFSTPLHFAVKHFGLRAALVPFPSGTGHMVTALRAGEIDIGIGLTEGWVAGLGKADAAAGEDGGYRLVGTYVETPLCWAISTGADRADISSIDSLKGSRIGVSRIGSGSYVMGFVLAEQQGWLQPSAAGDEQASESCPFADFVVCNTFATLRSAVNLSADAPAADFFMWEHFTSKKYYDNGSIKRVGEIFTPWSSWKIVSSTSTTLPENDPRVDDLLNKLNEGIAYFNGHHEEAVEYIGTALDYSAEDAREWLATVRFPENTRGVDLQVVERTVDVLVRAGVLERGRGVQPGEMVARRR